MVVTPSAVGRPEPTLPAGTITRGSLAALVQDLELRTVQDFRAVSAPAARAQCLAREHGWTDLEKRAELLTGDVLGRLGQVAEQGRIAKSVNMWAHQHGDRYLLARSHRLLAIFFRRLGDAAEALAQAVPAVEYADVMPPLIRCSHLITLALVLDLNGSYDDAHRRFVEALDIATAHDDAPLVVTVLNNMASPRTRTRTCRGPTSSSAGSVTSQVATTSPSTGCTWTRWPGSA